MIEEIRELQKILLKKIKTKYKRHFFTQIDFDKLTGIVGARGVGKTTYLIQYLKEHELPFSKKLYISADSIQIDSLFDIAKEFQDNGGKLLIIDEIHKFVGFENELKKIYDFLELQVIFSGNSALKLDDSKEGLGKRAVVYEVEGLSFREFLELKLGISLPIFTLDDILSNHTDIAPELLNKIDLKLFKEYIEYGYYPFYFDNKSSYKIKLNETINTALEVDIPSIFTIEYRNIKNLKKLIMLFCLTVPHTPNINELLSKMNMGSDYRTLYRYINYLHKTKIISIVKPLLKGDNIFVKPDKIYLNNTNLHFAYCDNPEARTTRELFINSMLKPNHTISIPKKGDFLVDEKITLEVGGKNKKYKEIKNIPNSYVIADDIEIGSGNKVPLWLLGFLY